MRMPVGTVFTHTPGANIKFIITKGTNDIRDGYTSRQLIGSQVDLHTSYSSIIYIVCHAEDLSKLERLIYRLECIE